ncbi:MAG TPA: tRNA (adenosine(37)-N6)-dimethylallyltransferase MiaA [Smithella sp.]|nr:tRNA (adenosine(37)-N6)-dimethylallyltransferase MiaA [Smithella sp.]HRS96950.1 tRNA (adenosine(37)-N6)-dimethylallyltransferase MiaA [Smithella sp.]
MSKNLIVILGPTASGKTHMAVRLALDLHGEIISADSRQVYKRMDIGTGKDLDQYTVGGRTVKYHLIDVVEPLHEFNVYEFQRMFYGIFSELSAKRVTPVLVGGTGLYLESVLLGYDLPAATVDEPFREILERRSTEELQKELLHLRPQLHNRTDLEDRERLIRAIEIETARLKKAEAERSRPDIDALVFGVKCERAALRARITQRLKERLSRGMIQEVENLHREGLSWERLERFGLEYRYIAQYLQGKLSLAEMTEKLNTAIHQFAKRQETWFRRMEKRGISIIWISPQDYDVMKETALKSL